MRRLKLSLFVLIYLIACGYMKNQNNILMFKHLLNTCFIKLVMATSKGNFSMQFVTKPPFQGMAFLLLTKIKILKNNNIHCFNTPRCCIILLINVKMQKHC